MQVTLISSWVVGDRKGLGLRAKSPEGIWCKGLESKHATERNLGAAQVVHAISFL
jgi:hypothetical protein